MADLGRQKFWSLHRRYRLGPTTDHSIPVHCGGDIHQFVSDHDATDSSAVVQRLKSLAPVLRARRGLSVPLTTRDGPRHGEVADGAMGSPFRHEGDDLRQSNVVVETHPGRRADGGPATRTSNGATRKIRVRA